MLSCNQKADFLNKSHLSVIYWINVKIGTIDIGCFGKEYSLLDNIMKYSELLAIYKHIIDLEFH